MKSNLTVFFLFGVLPACSNAGFSGQTAGAASSGSSNSSGTATGTTSGNSTSQTTGDTSSNSIGSNSTASTSADAGAATSGNASGSVAGVVSGGSSGVVSGVSVAPGTVVAPALSVSVGACSNVTWSSNTVCAPNLVMNGYNANTVSCCALQDQLSRPLVWSGDEIPHGLTAGYQMSNSVCGQNEFMTSIYAQNGSPRVMSIGCRKLISAASQPVVAYDTGSADSVVRYFAGVKASCPSNLIFVSLWDSNSDQDVDSFRCFGLKF